MKRFLQFLVAFVVSAAFLPLGAIAAHADTVGPENFEGFTLGSPNGQSGWSMTGSYDSAISDPSPPTAAFGDRALRISDSVTSGAFADQTYSAPLTNAAGEPTADLGGFPSGTLQPNFVGSFDFGSTTGTEQTGMHMSISPDNGAGGRMSYVRIEDSPTGYQVYFDDYVDVAPFGANGSEANGCDVTDPQFNETQIGTDLSFGDIHNIKFDIQLNSGPRNDVVKVYVDGTLAITGGSWEDYYRWCAESNPGYTNDVSRTIRTFEFRESGANHAGNAGNGYFIDNVSLISSDSSAPIVSNVSSTPDPTTAPGTVTLTATADDTTTGNNSITGAEYNVDGGIWNPMTATDLTFGDTTEGVTATVGPLGFGTHTLCVRATDSALNTSSGTDCTTANVLHPPKIKIQDRAVTEGDSGTTSAVFKVRLTHASEKTVTVNYTTVNGSARAGSDYVAKSGTVTFLPGQLHHNIVIRVKGDLVIEPNEFYSVALSGPVNATFGDSVGQGIILNDD